MSAYVTKSLTIVFKIAIVSVLITKGNNMTINLGRLDIVARFGIGALTIAAGGYLAFSEGNVYGLGLSFVGGVLMVTGLMKWCPMYAIFGLSSCPLTGEKR